MADIAPIWPDVQVDRSLMFKHIALLAEALVALRASERQLLGMYTLVFREVPCLFVGFIAPWVVTNEGALVGVCPHVVVESGF